MATVPSPLFQISPFAPQDKTGPQDVVANDGARLDGHQVPEATGRPVRMDTSEGGSLVPSERREHTRYRAHQKTHMAARLEGASYAALVEDISLGGARLRVEEPLPEGGELLLTHSTAGNLLGEVRWCREGEVGIAFASAVRALPLVVHCASLILDPQADEPRA